jgi:hypothetical protein
MTTPQTKAVAAYYDRLRQSGGARYSFAFSPSVAAHLVALSASRGVSKQRLVAQLIMAAEISKTI